jgi:hypothetical protein
MGWVRDARHRGGGRHAALEGDGGTAPGNGWTSGPRRRVLVSRQRWCVKPHVRPSQLRRAGASPSPPSV